MKMRKGILFKLLSLVVAAAYLVVTQPFLHDHDQHEGHDHHGNHDHSEAVHQTDDCHNFIYHGIAHEDSHDHQHVSEEFQECLTCTFFQSNPTELPFSQKLAELGIFSSDHSSHYISILFQESYLIPSKRGPPHFA